MTQKHRQDIEFDLRKLLAAMWRKLPWIAVCGLIAAVIVAAAEFWLVRPVYQSTTKMYILAEQLDMGVVVADLQSSTMLTKDYAELTQSRDVTEKVIEDLDLEESTDELLSKITISVPADTRIIELSVTDKDPERAKEIVEAVRDTAAEHISNVIKSDAVSIAEKANLPQDPVSPKILRDTVAAAMFGAAAAAVIFIILFLRDDRLRTREDIEDVLGISTLGTVPLEREKSKVQITGGQGFGTDKDNPKEYGISYKRSVSNDPH